MGFLDPKPLTPGALDSHPRLSATALNATIGEKVSDATEPLAPTDLAASAFSTLRSTIDLDLDDVRIGVVGDSTGAGESAAPRWVWLFAQKLATQHPTKTIVFYPWDVATNAYLAPITVQTGTGARTITIYNGSASGQNTTYSQTNLMTLLPAACDLVFVNHGHNMVGSDNTSAAEKYYSLGRDILRWTSPAAALVFVSQNPRTAVGATTNEHRQRLAKMAKLCATNGWGVLNLTQAFLDTPNWETLIPDGVHPDATGSQLWADYVWALYNNPRIKYAAPRAAPPATDRIWMPGNTFHPTTVVDGFPAVEVLGGWPTMEYGKATGTIAASASLAIPYSWQKVNIWIYWTVHVAAAGNVGWEYQYATSTRIGTEMSTGASTVGLNNLRTPAGPVFTAAPTVNYGEVHTVVARDQTLTPTTGTAADTSRTVLLHIRRVASNASDTFAQAANLVGVLVERSL